MGRTGRTYVAVGVYNPSVLFPSQVYPVFQQIGDKEDQSLFLQVCNETGDIVDFEKVLVSNSARIIPYNGIKMFAGIRLPAVYGFSFSEIDTILCRGRPEFCDLLSGLLADRKRSRPFHDPLYWLEVCRLLHIERMEAVFAGIAARKIANVSRKVAIDWARNAPLSSLARARAVKILARLQPASQQVDEEDIVATVALSNYAFAQGKVVQEKADGSLSILVDGVLYSGPPASEFRLYRSTVSWKKQFDTWPPRN